MAISLGPAGLLTFWKEWLYAGIETAESKYREISVFCIIKSKQTQ
jgi:hypothetical protein